MLVRLKKLEVLGGVFSSYLALRRIRGLVNGGQSIPMSGDKKGIFSQLFL
jgi:hypothetical protein